MKTSNPPGHLLRRLAGIAILGILGSPALAQTSAPAPAPDTAPPLAPAVCPEFTVHAVGGAHVDTEGARHDICAALRLLRARGRPEFLHYVQIRAASSINSMSFDVVDLADTTRWSDAPVLGRFFTWWIDLDVSLFDTGEHRAELASILAHEIAHDVLVDPLDQGEAYFVEYYSTGGAGDALNPEIGQRNKNLLAASHREQSRLPNWGKAEARIGEILKDIDSGG